MGTVMYGSQNGVLRVLLRIVLPSALFIGFVLRRRGLSWLMTVPIVVVSSVGVFALAMTVLFAMTLRVVGQDASAPVLSLRRL